VWFPVGPDNDWRHRLGIDTAHRDDREIGIEIPKEIQRGVPIRDNGRWRSVRVVLGRREADKGMARIGCETVFRKRETRSYSERKREAHHRIEMWAGHKRRGVHKR